MHTCIQESLHLFLHLWPDRRLLKEARECLVDSLAFRVDFHSIYSALVEHLLRLLLHSRMQRAVEQVDRLETAVKDPSRKRTRKASLIWT